MEGYEDFVQALMNISPVPIAFEDIPGDSKGYFSTAEKQMCIRDRLYPKADIKISGFEKTDYPNDFFDVAVGNVPFGQYKVCLLYTSRCV